MQITQSGNPVVAGILRSIDVEWNLYVSARAMPRSTCTRATAPRDDSAHDAPSDSLESVDRSITNVMTITRTTPIHPSQTHTAVSRCRFHRGAFNCGAIPNDNYEKQLTNRAAARTRASRNPSAARDTEQLNECHLPLLFRSAQGQGCASQP
jgi:hypothetical protein